MYDQDTELEILLHLVGELAADMRGAVYYTLGWAGAGVGHLCRRPRLRIDGNLLCSRCPDRPTVTLHIDGDALVVTFGASPRFGGFARFVFTLDDPADVARAKALVVRGFDLSAQEWAVRVQAGWSLDQIIETPPGGQTRIVLPSASNFPAG